MTIIYSVIARESVVLAEHSTSSGNFKQISEHILRRIPPGDGKMTYVYDRYLYHYIAQDGLVFLCLAEDSFGRRIPFAFLLDIQSKFVDKYGDHAKVASTYEMQEFSKVLDERMTYFSTNPTSDAFRAVQGQLSEVKDIMVHNIEKILERGERIDILVDKTDTLNAASFAFKKRSQHLRRMMWWKNIKLIVILSLVGVILLYCAISLGCGFPGWQNCVGKH